MSIVQKLKKLEYKKIAILGLGIENQALVKFLLQKKVKCKITICDFQSKEALGERYLAFARKKNIAWKLGTSFNKDLDGFDVLFRSPGWSVSCPGIQEALKHGVELTSSIRLFFEYCPTRKIIGVTGTKGKGTTATLIYEILKAGKKRVWLSGNIGIAPFASIEKIRKNEWVVLELSSFQLEDMERSPHIAVITNFSKEHLYAADPNNPNYHTSMKAYWQAKLNIIKWQKRGDKAIINENLRKKYLLHKKRVSYGRGKKTYFTKFNIPSRMPGEHNKENMAAAYHVAKLVGIKEVTIITTLMKFPGLEHRIELVRILDEVKYYNDSFATIPKSTITALKSFKKPIILLAGGAEKNSDYKKLITRIKKQVKLLILFKGEGSAWLKKQITNSVYTIKKIKILKNIKHATRVAKERVKRNEIVLMSPACASFGMFKNYKERGRLFKQEVNRLK